MSFTVSSASRRVAMAVLLGLAVLGGVIRYTAPNPSTLRDVGTLLLVLWVPAIGQLIGFLARKIPYSAPPPNEFAPASPFTPHLQADVTPLPLPGGLPPLAPGEQRCTVIVGRRGFTARLAQPVTQWWAAGGTQRAAIELLRPELARPHLAPGTGFHILAGTTAIARGEVSA
ncbi:MAG: hypothetical protein LCH79_15120 [Proteobacteria bacterium]|nr:hypothetical protein [Pseudomonadota bacterium]